MVTGGLLKKLSQTPPEPTTGNISQDIPERADHEHLSDLLTTSRVRIERIISHGQATPAGKWLEQEWDEWVLLLSGDAAVQIQGEALPRILAPGDYIHIPAFLKHRVQWTSSNQACIWLAIHYQPENRL